MKKLSLIMLVLLPLASYGQQNWLPEEIKVLNEFDINQEDHRGIVFTNELVGSKKFENLKEAVIFFLEDKTPLDLQYYTVQDFQKQEDYNGKILGLHELIQLHLKLEGNE
jgi:outer membrane lipoprotein-sorting protein